MSEQLTSISGSEKISFWNYCPEVLYDRFGLFANSLSRLHDEIDIDNRHKQLDREGALSNDWRWHWATMTPLHYSECSYYSLLQPVISKRKHIRKNEMDNKKVFISYVHENIEIIDSICQSFEQNSIDYWRDRNNIEPGKDWKLAIRNAIKSGALFLGCFSEESVTKEKTHMNEEILLAIDVLRSKKINSGWFIPIRLNMCKIPDYEIAPGKYLDSLQILDMFDDFGKNLERLVDVINKNVEQKKEKEEKINSGTNLLLNYQSLKSIIDLGSGYYFHNADMGHPVYMAGAKGIDEDNYWSYADGPKKNTIFKELSKLSKRLINSEYQIERYEWWYDFSTWKDFCSYVIGVYKKKKETNNL